MTHDPLKSLMFTRRKSNFPGGNRSIRLGTLLLVAGIAAATAGRAQGTLEVRVLGLEKAEGKVIVGLFRNAEGFLRKTDASRTIEVHDTSASVLFENLQPGAYAISVIHDRNNNGRLDKNRLGIPSEGFGFGNNAMGMFGPPSFDKATVIITDKPVKHVLRLRHF